MELCTVSILFNAQFTAPIYSIQETGTLKQMVQNMDQEDDTDEDLGAILRRHERTKLKILEF